VSVLLGSPSSRLESMWLGEIRYYDKARDMDSITLLADFDPQP
jgi:hypothetical protein